MKRIASNKRNVLKNIFNLRPYSWIDAVLIGLVGKFYSGVMDFGFMDSIMIIGIFLLWVFYNTSLELAHSYSYRAKPNMIIPIASFILLVSLALSFSYYAALAGLISCLLVLMYNQKNRGFIFGNLSLVLRGLIQCSYFFYGLFFYINSLESVNMIHMHIGLVIILLSSSRAIIADIRDIKHNRKMNKQTFPVVFGTKISIIVIEILSIISLLLMLRINIFCLPVFLLGIALLFYDNGYVLHQLMITTTSFTSYLLITNVIGNNLIMFNIIFISVFLNLIFYPLLERKSNPKFMQPNKISFFMLRKY